jgi:hypothetical protein
MGCSALTLALGSSIRVREEVGQPRVAPETDDE